MIIKRRKTRIIKVGDIQIGGDAPISVQSMTKTKTSDVKATLRQIHRLKKAGCEIVRVSVPDEASAKALKDIVRESMLPIIADIHFNYQLALKAIDAGVNGLRLNPGNISDRKKIELIAKKALERDIPIRVGVNSGSIEKDLLEKYKTEPAYALVESALRNVRLLERLGFENIKISLKSSSVITTIEAYRIISTKTDYPLHLGITESGFGYAGAVKSAIGLGILLAEGIGDTIRVSLSADPVEEVKVGYEILKALGLRQKGPEIISCPTCGRCRIDVVGIAKKIEKRLKGIDASIKIAVMGCEVNGLGEAREADIGITGTKGLYLLFKKGKVFKKIRHSDPIDVLYNEIEKILTQ